MKKDFKFFLKLFTSTFTVSAFTFGGGYVIVPLLKKKFVDELKWIEEGEMLDFIALAQSSPGAIAVNTAIMIGFKMAGVLGAMITVIATVLPCLIVLSVISLFYEAIKQSELISAMLRGMQAGVVAVLADVVVGMGGKVLKTKKILSVIIMVSAFAAVFFLKINVLYVILACIVLGTLSVFLFQKQRKEEKK